MATQLVKVGGQELAMVRIEGTVKVLGMAIEREMVKGWRTGKEKGKEREWEFLLDK